MQRTTLLLGALLSLACGDPKGSAGAIGAPVQNMDPSKMNKSAKDQKEWKLDPADQKEWKLDPGARAVKLNPDTPIEQKGVTDTTTQKVTPTAPVDQKIQ